MRKYLFGFCAFGALMVCSSAHIQLIYPKPRESSETLQHHGPCGGNNMKAIPQTVDLISTLKLKSKCQSDRHAKVILTFLYI